MSLTVGSLFSGIGGLDLGLERAGMNVIWQSEIDPYSCRVLKKHWPEVPNYGDIKKINWRNVIRPDVICGGYPCQPFSTAGKRNGTDDPRHLWPWVREAISELRPKYAILENVRGHVSLGLSTVIGELASIGYDAEWQVVSAASVGAPHRRDRIIIVAYANGGRLEKCQSESEQAPGFSCSCEQCAYPIGELANTDNGRPLHGQPEIFTANRWFNALSLIGAGCTNVADTDNTRERTPERRTNRDGPPTVERRNSEPQLRTSRRGTNVADTDTRQTIGWVGRVSTDTEQIRTERNNTRGKEGHAGGQWWQTEPDVGRVANGVSARVDRLKGLGNAVVPQVAELIGRMVTDYDTETK